MLRHLSFATLFLFTSCATEDPARGQPPAVTPVVVGQVTLPIQAAAVAGSAHRGAEGGAQRGPRTFGGRAVQGTLTDSGAWTLRVEVTHRGLRCAAYETGLRIGTGDPDCAQVRWLTDIQNATRLTQCNGATRVHAGSGTIDLDPDAIASARCVQVVTRCIGPCRSD